MEEKFYMNHHLWELAEDGLIRGKSFINQNGKIISFTGNYFDGIMKVGDIWRKY